MEPLKDFLAELSKNVRNQVTFLSPRVHEIFVDTIKQLPLANYEENEDFVNWNRLTPILLQHEERKLHPTLRSEKWYNSHCQLLAPFLLSTHTAMCSFTEAKLQEMLKMTRWMKQTHTLELCFHLWDDHNRSGSLLSLYECVLLITAALERSLGNIFYLASKRKKPVPSLLRDLLGTEELNHLLGETTIIALQILMGSPLSFNLRNLMWHGFVGLEELNSVFASTMLCMCASIGRKLHEPISEVIEHLAVEDDSVVPRPWICFPHTQILSEISPLLDIDEDHHQGWESLCLVVSQSQIIPNSMRDIWMGAIEYYRQGNYGRCCALLVPQMELLLRLMFCAANQCPDRVLTAESTVLYTTLDVILAGNGQSEESLSSRPNKIKELLGDPLYWDLRDMFTLPEGPRVRDRLSHAECRLTDIDVILCNHLLFLSKSLLVLFVSSDNSIPRHDQQSKLEKIFPLFHPATIFRRELSSALLAIDTWTCYLVNLVDPQNDAENSCITFMETGVSHSNLLQLLQLFKFPAPIIPILLSWMQNPLCTNRVLSKEIMSFSDTQTLYRLIDNLGTYRQIARGIRTVVQLISASIENYLSQQQSAIRTRRRLTFSRLLNYCPLYVTALQVALLYPISIVVASDHQQIAATRTDKGKWLRNTASFTDKAASLSRSHKNRWLELAQLAHRFLSQHSVPSDQYM